MVSITTLLVFVLLSADDDVDDELVDDEELDEDDELELGITKLSGGVDAS